MLDCQRAIVYGHTVNLATGATGASFPGNSSNTAAGQVKVGGVSLTGVTAHAQWLINVGGVEMCVPLYAVQ